MRQKVAIYTRVSTSYQIDKDSLPLQKKDLENYCEIILGIKEYEIFEDAGYSAKNTDRPAFQNMMARLRNGEFSHVLVWKLDRISRNIGDFATMWDEFEKLGVQFISKNDNFQTDSPMGRAMLNIIMTFAQLEREMTAVRVSAVMVNRAKEGKWNGANIPLGYKFNEETKFPMIDEGEAKTVHVIFDKYEEIKSTHKLAIYLNDNHYNTKRGGVWSSKTVGQILKNPFYKGTLRYNYRQAARGKIKSEDEWVIVENNHDAIIDVSQWERVQTIISKNGNGAFRQITQTHTHIFSGLLKCNKCGGGFSSYRDRERSNGFRPSIYYCSNKGHGRNCDLKGYISDMAIGEFVLNYMSNMMIVKNDFNKYKDNIEERLLTGKIFKNVAYVDSKSIEVIIKMIEGYSPTKNKIESIKENSMNQSVEVEALTQRKTKLERAKKRLDDLFLFDDEAMTEKEYLSKRNSIIDDINSIELQIRNATPKIQYENTNGIYNNSQLDKCIVEWSLDSEEYIEYKKLALNVGNESLKEFFNLLLERVTIGENRQILEIKFKNGLTQKFLYR